MESTNLDPWGPQSLNDQPKNTHGLDLGLPHTYVADVQLGLHVCPKQLERELSATLWPLCGMWSSIWADLPGFSGRGRA